ncbi:unnamed protein product [Macrosiphum euphorbiae]|uniref:Uncharacterized protein n=1 Tax=Macrosiphum euphorbiae TaxID=13131 RepID=A0AAV0VLB8_9HEMI|nr:unnamed protein product [Macrosiphum euphorbiae]
MVHIQQTSVDVLHTKKIVNIQTAKQTTPKELPKDQLSATHTTTPDNSISLPKPGPKHLDYASATKNKHTINNEKVVTLLSELLTAISSAEDPKAVISLTIKSFISLLTNNNE